VLPSVARYETDADTGAKRLLSSFTFILILFEWVDSQPRTALKGKSS
jgi:hypothetical protein